MDNQLSPGTGSLYSFLPNTPPCGPCKRFCHTRYAGRRPPNVYLKPALRIIGRLPSNRPHHRNCNGNQEKPVRAGVCSPDCFIESFQPIAAVAVIFRVRFDIKSAEPAVVSSKVECCLFLFHPDRHGYRTDPMNGRRRAAMVKRRISPKNGCRSPIRDISTVRRLPENKYLPPAWIIKSSTVSSS